MVTPPPGYVAVDSISIVLYLIPLVISLRWLIIRFNKLRATRRIFYSLMVIFCIVREIHICLNLAYVERAPPFNDKKYLVRSIAMITWTAVLGIYLLYSALMVMVYEWASLLTRANLASHNRLTVIVIIVVAAFNLQYFILLTIQVETHISTTAVAYASIGCASILTLIPAVFYYLKIRHTLGQSKSYYTDKHKKILLKLKVVIVPVCLGLMLRSAIAWAVSLKGGNTFLNFYVWITLFWILPELIPVTIMLIAINPSSKSKKNAGVTMTPENTTTSSTLHLQGSGTRRSTATIETKASRDSNDGALV